MLYVSLNVGGHCFFSELGHKVKVGNLAVFFKGVFVKCRFLWRGMTMERLNLSGKTSSWWERFMILVIEVRGTSRPSLVTKFGQGSKSNDFVGDLDMSILISS